MTPTVSVLVLAYNHGPYLADALDSILKQQASFSFEILVGEDRSADDTLEIAERYQAAHPSLVRVITAERNVGMQENFRRLIHASRGSYLAFCEGDDYWNSCTKLDEQVAFLEERPDYGAVHSDFTHIAQIGASWKALPRYWRHHAVSIPQGAIFDELVKRNFIQTCTLVVRTELARQYLDSGLPADSYKVADWPLCLYVSARSKVGFIDKQLSTYRKVEGSAMNQGYDSDVSRARDHMSMVSDFCRLFDRPPELETEAHANFMTYILVRSLQAGRKQEAREALSWFDQHPGSNESSFRSSVRRFLALAPGGPQAFRIYARHVEASALRRYKASPPDPGDCS